MDTPRVGFIGLGVMGRSMAGHLAHSGYPLTVLDVDASTVDALAAAHPDVRVASTPKAVAEAADIVITMLPSGEYVRGVALGDSGLIEGFVPGSLLLDTSSCEPWVTVRPRRRSPRWG